MSRWAADSPAQHVPVQPERAQSVQGAWGVTSVTRVTRSSTLQLSPAFIHQGAAGPPAGISHTTASCSMPACNHSKAYPQHSPTQQHSPPLTLSPTSATCPHPPRRLLQGIAHRDIKPENVFHTADGVWKLGDFGSAVWLERLDKRPLKLEGTFSFAAPEYVALWDKCTSSQLQAATTKKVRCAAGLQGLLRGDTVWGLAAALPSAMSTAVAGMVTDAVTCRLCADAELAHPHHCPYLPVRPHSFT